MYANVNKSCSYMYNLQLNEGDVENVDSTHEVVVFGPDGVGKTTIINCFVDDPNPNIRELDQRFVSFKVLHSYLPNFYA